MCKTAFSPMLPATATLNRIPSWEGAEDRLHARFNALKQKRLETPSKKLKSFDRVPQIPQQTKVVTIQKKTVTRHIRGGVGGGARDKKNKIVAFAPIAVEKSMPKSGLPECARIATQVAKKKFADKIKSDREMLEMKRMCQQMQAKRRCEIQEAKRIAAATLAEAKSKERARSIKAVTAERNALCKKGAEERRMVAKKVEQLEKDPLESEAGTETFSAEDIDACLKAHNELRALHGVSPLKWSNGAATNATAAANQCVEKRSLHHSNHEGQGQNAASNYATFKDAVEAWYGEIKSYNFKKPCFDMKTGHFTQVVWKGTTHVGMAKDTNGTGSYIVANYFPPGNFMGQFGEGVPQLSKFDVKMFQGKEGT